MKSWYHLAYVRNLILINTVLGPITKEKLGNTRIHEHILWAWTGTSRQTYDKAALLTVMVPYLKELKSLGCDTLVEMTPLGAGRDVSVLKELSEKTGLNIIANCGVWDGLDYNQVFVPTELLTMKSNDIAKQWINEYKNGIDGTLIKPGVIKIGLGDNDQLSSFQLEFLKAAFLTSEETSLPIVAHICSSYSARQIVRIMKELNFNLKKFIWSHADFSFDIETIVKLVKDGIKIELSWHVGTGKKTDWYKNLFKELSELNLLDNVFLSQDAGGFHNGKIVSYSEFYSHFLLVCFDDNLASTDIISKLMIDNPAKVLDI
ncbi:hypothetical protein KAR48_09275 [bacterium]|nr:hypothetical protein [bacterium]